MSKINDGGPAFPRTMWTGSEGNAAHRDVPGISMRDYFAAKAMQASLSRGTPVNTEAMAKAAYAYADAMLAQREK